MTEEELLRDAVSAYYNVRDYARAAALFKELVASGHNEAKTFIMLACCEAHVTKDRAAAEPWLNKAKLAGAADDEIIACRCAIEWAVGSEEESLRLAKQAARMNPSAENLRTLFAALQDVSPKDAEFVCREMIKRYPRRPEGYDCLGALELEQDRFEESVRHLERAIELDPDDLNTRASLGDAYYELGEYAKARKCFVEVEKHETANPHSGLYLIGMCILKGDGERDLARQYFERALAEKPDFEEAQQALTELDTDVAE